MVKICLTFVLLLASAFAQAPSAPDPQPRQVHLYTFRGPEDPPLRTNRQTLKTKTFWLSQSLGIASMIVACRNPRSGEDFHSEAPAVGALFGLSYLSERYLSGLFPIGIGTYETIHYTKAALK
jgi:hypothetical protein